MRAILTIFFLSLFTAQAQPPMFKMLVKRQGGLLLDTYTGAKAAYSLRKLKTSYAGSAVRVRRSSDNTEQDIGFISGSGDLDTAALKTFVGTGGTDDGFIVTWYSQTGSNDVTQSTTTQQPKIMDNGVIYRLGGKPTIYSDGTTNIWLTASNFMGSESAGTVYEVTAADADPATVGAGPVVENKDNTVSSHQPFSDGNIYDGFLSTVRKTTGNPSTSLSSMYLYCAISASNDWRSYINNTLHYSTTTNTYGATTPFQIFEGYTTGVINPYAGKVSEVVIFSGASSNGDRNGISGNINTYYTIY